MTHQIHIGKISLQLAYMLTSTKLTFFYLHILIQFQAERQLTTRTDETMTIYAKIVQIIIMA